MALVYLATSPSGKRYVGWTSRTLQQRRWQHESSARKSGVYALSAALRKYPDSMRWDVLVDGIDDALARQLEIAFIRLFDSRANGYNLTDGGEGVSGLRFSDASREKMRRSQNSPETQAKRSAALAVAYARPDVKARRSAAAKEAGNRPEVRESRRVRRARAWEQPGAREAAVAAMRETWGKPEVRANMSRVALEVCARPETKRKKSDARRKLSVSQVTNVRILLALGANQYDAADWFSVHQGTISNINRNVGMAYQ